MALKRFKLGPFFYQFEEGKEPEGAVLAEVQEKAAEPQNKARRATNKARTPKAKKE